MLDDRRAACPRPVDGSARDLRLDGMPREKVLALAFRLLDLAYLRVGGEGYALQHGSYGLATLLRSHVRSWRPRATATPGACT